MLKIRLARVGKKKKPLYRIIISDSKRDTFGSHLEILGHYNPFSKVCEVKKDRVLYWVEKGAKISPTLNNLLIDQNVISGKKVKAYRTKKKEGQQATGEKPAGEKKEETKPAEEKKEEGVKPVEEKPTEERPAETKPVEDN